MPRLRQLVNSLAAYCRGGVMLYVIGLGLYDEKDITVRSVE